MTISIRKSTKADRANIILVADKAFEKSKTESFEFRYPMLFNDERINDYYLAEDDGVLVGLLGAYKIDLVVNKVCFKACGIGKVSCLREYRNQGVMTTLLKFVVDEMKKEKVDVSYLWGDRFRYANFGWVEGGESQTILFSQKKLMPLLSSDKVKVVTSDDASLVYKLLSEKFSYLDYKEEDIESMLLGKRLHGYKLNGSFVFWTYDKTNIVEALGKAEDILKLASFCLIESQKQDKEIKIVQIETSKNCEDIQAILADYAWRIKKNSSANFRIINFKTFLEKFLKATKFKVPNVSEKITIGSIESNEAFTISFDENNFSITECDTKSAIMLNEKDLSEVFFGQFPSDTFLKRLPKNSIFRNILPLTDLHISKFYLL